MGKHRRELEKRRRSLIRRARGISVHAVSYRGFNVGCMVLAFNGKRYETFYGVNIKPFEDGPKVCAEQAAIVSALANGYNTIVAIVVAGVPQNEPDAKSGVKTETLHPCYICRRILRGLPGISDETAIITIHNHKGNVEEQTFGELLKLHSEWS